jgi:hypothetical protein
MSTISLVYEKEQAAEVLQPSCSTSAAHCAANPPYTMTSVALVPPCKWCTREATCTTISRLHPPSNRGHHQQPGVPRVNEASLLQAKTTLCPSKARHDTPPGQGPPGGAAVRQLFLFKAHRCRRPGLRRGEWPDRLVASGLPQRP